MWNQWRLFRCAEESGEGRGGGREGVRLGLFSPVSQLAVLALAIGLGLAVLARLERGVAIACLLWMRKRECRRGTECNRIRRMAESAVALTRVLQVSELVSTSMRSLPNWCLRAMCAVLLHALCLPSSPDRNQTMAAMFLPSRSRSNIGWNDVRKGVGHVSNSKHRNDRANAF